MINCPYCGIEISMKNERYLCPNDGTIIVENDSNEENKMSYKG